MSVVVWDGKTLAADRQATLNNTKCQTRKITRLPSGDLLAWVGNSESGLALLKWYLSGADPETWPEVQKGDDWSRLIVVHKGKVWEYEQTPVKIPLHQKFGAWGSGSDLAIGALAMGADAVQAVKIASKFNIYCGLGVDHYEADR